MSVERNQEFWLVPSESAGSSRVSVPAPAGWPKLGGIRIRDLHVRYRPGLELVLRGLNVYIRPTEKVAIVGRTGSGPSRFSRRRCILLLIMEIVVWLGGKP